MRTALRFGAVGVVNTVIDLAGFTALQMVGVGAVAANLVSTSAGVTSSFLLNRRYTFPADTAAPARRVAAFLLVTLGGLWILHPLVIAVVSSALPVGLPAVWAAGVPKLAAVGVGTVWNYVLYDRVVFPAVSRVAS